MDDLAVRRELLLAQSAMQRAQLRHQVIALRSGGARAVSWVGKAARFLSIARTVLSVVRLFKG